jgi:UDP-glucose 6-dehydrogenase
VRGCPTNMAAFFSVVRAISDSIADQMRVDQNLHKVIIEKSTVPIGTAAALKD